jgi:hypothetical protein
VTLALAGNDARGVERSPDGHQHLHASTSASKKESKRPAKAPKDRCEGKKLKFLEKSKLCTHGRDPAPAGMSVAEDVEPLSADETAQPAFVPCDGDGVSGDRVQVIYARANDVTNRYLLYLASIRQWAEDADNIFNNSAAETGGARHIRFVHDANCIPTVLDVTLPNNGDDTFDNTINALSNQGFNKTNRKYMLFVDANVYCGIGGIWPDDQPGSANSSNFGPSYGRSDTGCWSGDVAAHELMHNLGGVQMSAPNTSGGWHCVDEWDVMCYSDTPNFPTMRIECANGSHDLRFDCKHDDYYNTDPNTGSYLDTHWNTADNAFLIGGDTAECPDTSFEPDNTAAQARSFPVGNEETHAFCTDGDQDWVSFAAAAGQTYQIETSNLGLGVDTVLDLYRPDGTTLVSSNDDHNGNASSLITFTPATAGTYFVRVGNAGGASGPGVTYDLSITLFDCPDAAMEPDDTASQAHNIAIGATQSHAFCLEKDWDWVNFTATAGTLYRIETLNLADGTDTILDLYQPNHTTLITSNDDGGGGLASLIRFTPPATGTYYLKVRSFDGIGDPHNTYDLRISVLPNRLVNPGFELDANSDGRPDGWTSNARFTRNGAIKYAGSFSGRHQATDNSGHTIQQNVGGLNGGVSYNFSGRVRIPATSDVFTYRLQVVWRNSSNAIITSRTVKTYSAATGSTWDQASASLVAPAGTTKAQVRLVASNLKATIYVDDLSFR